MNNVAALIEGNIELPLPPARDEAEGMELYSRFMRHLRCVPNSKGEIKVLCAIQFTSDMMDCSDAHIAKMLVEMGLRAPRLAFPSEFLNYMDDAMMRSGWEVGGPSAGMVALKEFWDGVGEDKFSAFRRGYSLAVERAVA